MRFLSDITKDGVSAFGTPDYGTPVSDTSGSIYFYKGWSDVEGVGVIQRQLVSDGSVETATVPLADFTTSWDARSTTLDYTQ